jgi:hypothetical protein
MRTDEAPHLTIFRTAATDDGTHNPTCVMCDRPATTTAAHIPVCEPHYNEYKNEAEAAYGHYRPFWIKLKRADTNRQASQRRADMEALLLRVAELEAENERLSALLKWYEGEFHPDWIPEELTKLKPIDLVGDHITLTAVEHGVILLRRKHAETWRGKPENYWLAALLEEFGELGSALNGEHEHDPDYELRQISAICMNWLEMRAKQ